LIVLDLDHGYLVGADIRSGNMDLHLEGAVTGVDHLSGDADDPGDLLIVKPGQGNLHRGSDPYSFLVNLRHLDDDLEIMGVEDLQGLASGYEGLSYFYVQRIDSTGDVGIDIREIKLILGGLYGDLRHIDLVLCVDEVHFRTDLLIPEILA